MRGRLKGALVQYIVLAMRVQVGFVFALASCFASLWSCESGPFNATYEPGFPHTSGMTVSVLGVYKDGRMSSDAWSQIGPVLSSPMRSSGCEIAYDSALVARDPEGSSAVDAYTRAEGPTDELLDQFGPAAEGDEIMLVTISGHPPQAIGGADAGASQRASSPRGAGGSGRGMGGGRRSHGGAMPSAAQEQHETTDGNVFEISALLFSVRQHHTVAALSLKYSGRSVDEALGQFAEKFRLELPHAQCKGWHWTAPLDLTRIQNKTEP